MGTVFAGVGESRTGHQFDALFSQPENPSCAFFEVLGGERLLSESGECHGAYGWRNLAALAAACPIASSG
jgi:hypothetical protein